LGIEFKKTMEIIDNFLSEGEHYKFFNLIKSNYFPWFLSEVVNYELNTCSELDNYQFSYIFYSVMNDGQVRKGRYFDASFPFFKKLTPKNVLMIKSNLTLRTNKIIEHGMHVDHHFDGGKTAVYYVNDNDGYTKFEDGTIVESVANRIVIF